VAHVAVTVLEGVRISLHCLGTVSPKQYAALQSELPQRLPLQSFGDVFNITQSTFLILHILLTTKLRCYKK